MSIPCKMKPGRRNVNRWSALPVGCLSGPMRPPTGRLPTDYRCMPCKEHDCSCADRHHYRDRDDREQYAEYYAPEDHDAHRDEREGDSGIL
jgi:hypothetical protein